MRTSAGRTTRTSSAPRCTSSPATCRRARARLVDAVLDDPEVSSASHLAASMPTGDTELLDRVRERADTVEVRAAGATKLVDADLRHDQ